MSQDHHPVDLDAMLAQAQEQATRVAQLQADVETTQTLGQSAHGLIRVTVRGTGHIVDVTIDADAVRYYDAGALGGLVLEAISDGMRRAVMGARERFGTVLDDLSAFDAMLERWPQPAGARGTARPGQHVGDDDGW